MNSEKTSVRETQPRFRVEQLTEADAPALLPFLDRAFGFEPEKNGFLTFLPKLYRQEARPWEYNLAIRDPDTGALGAVLGMYPLTLCIAGRSLRCMALGNMAVDESLRGQGLMSALMRAATERIRSGQYELAVLGGQRQRYATFGFEPTGADRVFRLSAANFRHCFGGVAPDVTVRRAEGEGVIPILAALHDAQPVRAERNPACLPDILRSWGYEPWLAYRGEVPIGYFLRKENEIREPVLRDPEDLLPLLLASRPEKGDLLLTLSPWETGLCLRAAEIAEDVGRMQWEKFAVYRFTPVLQALLTLVASEQPLDNGSLTVCVEDTGWAETLTVCVRDGVPSVRQSHDRPDLTLTYSDAMAFFFSDFSKARTVCRNPLRWLFPLPLSLRMADHA